MFVKGWKPMLGVLEAGGIDIQSINKCMAWDRVELEGSEVVQADGGGKVMGQQMEVKVEALWMSMGLEEGRTWAGQVAVAQGTGKTVGSVDELQCQGIG
jgi:hypothetical protein